MNEDEGVTTGVLVMRGWVEPGRGDGLRVRITRSISEDGTGQAVSSAASVDGACAIVRVWLEELLREHRRRPGPDGSSPRGGSTPQ